MLFDVIILPYIKYLVNNIVEQYVYENSRKNGGNFVFNVTFLSSLLSYIMSICLITEKMLYISRVTYYN